MDRLRITAFAGLVALTLGACASEETAGSGSSPSGAARTVQIAMVDTAFEPDTVAVEAGETIRFVFTNNGTVEHDAFIGDADAQRQHGEDMTGDHGGHGDDSSAITVEPGKTGELTRTFGDDGRAVLIGCHRPGHYEAGMVATITVT